MKRGWKIFLITDLIILLLGIMVSIIGWAVGDRAYLNESWDEFWQNGSWHHLHIVDRLEDLDHININIGSDMEDIEFDAIDISCKAGDIDIVGDERASCVSTEGLNTGLKVVDRDGLLVLESENDNVSFGDIDIEVEKDKKLEYVKVSIGSGDLDVSDIEARQMDVKVSAGDADLYDVTADNMNLTCSMGDIDFEHSRLCYQDFNYDLNCKAGKVELDGESYSGMNVKRSIQNSAHRNINISCKMGDITLEMQNEKRHHD